MTAVPPSDPRTASLGVILAIGAGIILPLSAVAPLGIAPLGAVIALLVAALILTGWAPRPRIAVPAALLIALLVAWAAISISWSSVPDRALTTAFRLVLIALAGTVIVASAANLDPSSRVAIRKAVVLGFTVTVAGLLVVVFTIHARTVLTGAAPLTALLWGSNDTAALLIGFNRAASVVALMVWPACIIAAGYRPAAAIGLFAATAALLVVLNSSAPVVALFLGGVVFAVAFFRPRLAAVALAVGIVVLSAASPTITKVAPAFSRATQAVEYVDGSLNHRLQIWNFVAARVNERLITGWGLDASRALGRSGTVVVTTSTDGKQVAAEILPLHPHNALLQVWVELGLPGAVLTTLLLLWLVRHISRAVADPLARAAAFGALTSGLVIAELSFGFWQGWWQATLWLTAALTAAILPPPVSAPAAADPPDGR